MAELEIDRHDWQRFHCGCGFGAGHMPKLFHTLLRSQEPQPGLHMGEHAEIDAELFEVAVPVTQVTMAVLADPAAVSPYVREMLLADLWRIVGGETHYSETLRGVEDIELRCQEVVRGGIWSLYREASRKGDRSMVFGILDSVENDRERLAYYSRSLGG